MTKHDAKKGQSAMKKREPLRNYIREGQKLPLFGIGPAMIAGMGAVALAGILLSGNILRSGIVPGAWAWIFRIVGALCVVFGVTVWYIGALKSDMDDHITENRLKTDGIYAWVRNPMYSGWLFAFFGIALMWHNLWLLPVFPIDWLIMTVVLKRTEERWLDKLYGAAYAQYCRRVNRCIPWKRL